MYHLEIITNNEMLVYSQDFNNKQAMMIAYDTILHNYNTWNKYKGNQLQLFEGQDYENMKELVKYRKDL